MRISDWSSDVCSSDLRLGADLPRRGPFLRIADHAGQPVLAQPALLRRLFGRGLGGRFFRFGLFRRRLGLFRCGLWGGRSEEHTSELQSLMRLSYAVFCLKKKNINNYLDSARII